MTQLAPLTPRLRQRKRLGLVVVFGYEGDDL